MINCINSLFLNEYKVSLHSSERLRVLFLTNSTSFSTQDANTQLPQIASGSDQTPLWWFIFCVNFTGPWAAQIFGQLYSGCVFKGVSGWYYYLNRETEESRWASPGWIGLRLIKNLSWTKTEAEGILPACLSPNGGHLLSSDWNLNHQLSWFSYFRAWTRTYTTDSPGFQVFWCRLEPSQQLSWGSSLPTSDLRTSQPPESREPIPCNESLYISLYIFI